MIDVKVGKSKSQIVDPSIQPPSTSHDLDPIEEKLEWFSNCMESKVKVDPSTFKDHINESNLESNPNKNLIVFGGTQKPLRPTFHDTLFCELLDQPTSNINDVQLVSSSGNQEEGSFV